ncbi:MAG: hypothetical protein NW226_26625 [Microscillaceae bacterium]|nr:hypothetical protein [Microscillaceae bacterium]
MKAMNDTNPEMRKKQLEIIFQMTPRQRFEQGLQMIDFVRNTVENSIKKKIPDISATQLKIEIFKRYYGKDFSESEKTRIIQHFLALENQMLSS